MTSTYKSVHILTSIAIVITAVITMPAWQVGRNHEGHRDPELG